MLLKYVTVMGWRTYNRIFLLGIRRLLFLGGFLTIGSVSSGQYTRDTSNVGIYLKDLYDFYPSEFSFGADFYLWSNSTDSSPLFSQIEIVNAKVIGDYSSFMDKENGRYITYKNCKAHLTHNWELRNYPFDRQKLRIVLEAQNPLEFLYVSSDSSGFQLAKALSIPGWHVTGHGIEKSLQTYPTDFGYQKSVVKDKRFNQLAFAINLERKSWGLYFKLFLGLHIAFLVSSLAFFVRPDYVDPRFGLSIGGLFASVANKYVVDANIPATLGFSFVDMVHFGTFIAILSTLVCSTISLKLFTLGQFQLRKRLDRRFAIILASTYILLNLILIIFAKM